MNNGFARMAVMLWLMLAFSISAFAQVEKKESKEVAELWRAIKAGEALVIMRHALAPGTGDPAEFSLDDCQTQRNLSAEGWAQARQIGQSFRDQGILNARIYTSAWCRCRDTAVALDLGEVKTLPALNSFFQAPGRETFQTRQLTYWLQSQPVLSATTVLVTHQVNITALTGIFPRSGEMIVLDLMREGFPVLGRLSPPAL